MDLSVYGMSALILCLAFSGVDPKRLPEKKLVSKRVSPNSLIGN